jgi:hypothetical protein
LTHRPPPCAPLTTPKAMVFTVTVITGYTYIILLKNKILPEVNLLWFFKEDINALSKCSEILASNINIVKIFCAWC